MKIADLIWLGERLADTGRQEMRTREPGVPSAEFVIMRHLLENSPSTITALVDRTGYAQSRVSTLVASLVDRGWAQTTSDPTDGRRTLVSAPEHVRQEADRGLNADSRTLERLLAGRSPARRKAILGALAEVLEVLRDESVGDTETSRR